MRVFLIGIIGLINLILTVAYEVSPIFPLPSLCPLEVYLEQQENEDKGTYPLSIYLPIDKAGYNDFAVLKFYINIKYIWSEIIMLCQ